MSHWQRIQTVRPLKHVSSCWAMQRLVEGGNGTGLVHEGTGLAALVQVKSFPTQVWKPNMGLPGHAPVFWQTQIRITPFCRLGLYSARYRMSGPTGPVNGYDWAARLQCSCLPLFILSRNYACPFKNCIALRGYSCCVFFLTNTLHALLFSYLLPKSKINLSHSKSLHPFLVPPSF